MRINPAMGESQQSIGTTAEFYMISPTPHAEFSYYAPDAGEILQAYFAGEILTIRITEVYDSNSCAKLAELAHERLTMEGYAVAPAFRKGNLSAYELAGATAEVVDAYHDLSTVWHLRELMGPVGLPSDRLRVMFDERLPAGAMLERFLALRPAPTGQIRSLHPQPGSKVLFTLTIRAAMLLLWRLGMRPSIILLCARWRASPMRANCSYAICRYPPRMNWPG